MCSGYKSQSHSSAILQDKNSNKYQIKMKFLVPLLVVLAISEAEKFQKQTDINHHHHRNADIENLARSLATMIFTRMQNNNNIKPVGVQPVQTFPAQPIQTYDTKLARTDAEEPVQIDADEPIRTNASESVQTYTEESVQPQITSYRRHRTVNMPAQSNHQ